MSLTPDITLPPFFHDTWQVKLVGLSAENDMNSDGGYNVVHLQNSRKVANVCKPRNWLQTLDYGYIQWDII